MANSNLSAIRPQSTPRPGYLPFEDVQFTWDASDRYIQLEYSGLAERLIECGAIEPDMAEKSKRPKRRIDSVGHPYNRVARLDVETMTPHVRITRLIGDPKYAETLPGVPRGLRFKRLDWLDAHPDELHQHIDVRINRLYVHRRKLLAGTAVNFMAIAGYSEEAFRGKLRQRTGYHGYLGDDEPGNRGESTWLVRLMRGYFEIQFDDIREKPTSTSPPADPPPPRRHMRLVINKDAAPVVRAVQA
jgi:hypothetical protein